MGFDWLAIALDDVVWLTIAFVLGMLARSVSLPPMLGFLATGFLLKAFDVAPGAYLDELADLGVTLLLFTVGLKLDVRSLTRPHVWGAGSLHMAITVAVFGTLIYWLAIAGVPFVADLTFEQSILIAFGLSFSSTVFAVKILEDGGEMNALYGRIAIGVLIVQDIAAAVFLAVSDGKVPSIWALGLLLLIPARPLLLGLLNRAGHGELLVLLGLLLALGGAEAFEMVRVKGDLGALILGALLANHPKSDELAKTMLGFKDLFLLGFFLSIGLAGEPTTATLVVGALLAVVVFAKSALFFVLFIAFRLRARTNLLSTLSLTNYSEFGLIVIGIAVSYGWIGSEWLIALAIALTLSFVTAAVLNRFAQALYDRYIERWRRLQRTARIAEDAPIETAAVTHVVVGMGRVGTAAYDALRERFGEGVTGIDADPLTVERHTSDGRNVVLGDPRDADFWDRLTGPRNVQFGVLALPTLSAGVGVLRLLRGAGYQDRVAAVARYPEDSDILQAAGADVIFDVSEEKARGVAALVTAQFDDVRSV